LKEARSKAMREWIRLSLVAFIREICIDVRKAICGINDGPAILRVGTRGRDHLKYTRRARNGKKEKMHPTV